MALIILGRDGIINHESADLIKSPAEWEPIEGSLEAIARLNQAGYRVVVITNQSGIAKGLFNVDDLNRIHSKMRRMLAQVGGKIEAILFCPHGPDDECDCRKPQDGSYAELSHRLRINLEGVPAVGNLARDLSAARSAGAQPILVRTGRGSATEKAGVESDVLVYDDLAAVAQALLEADK